MTNREAKITLPFLLLCNILAMILLVLAQGGCGPSVRDKTLSAMLVGVNATRDGFVEWDKQHQRTIADAATSVADGEAKLAAYHKAREPVIRSFEIAYRALAVAAIHGDTPLPTVIQAAADLAEAIKQLKAGP